MSITDIRVYAYGKYLLYILVQTYAHTYICEHPLWTSTAVIRDQLNYSEAFNSATSGGGAKQTNCRSATRERVINLKLIADSRTAAK